MREEHPNQMELPQIPVPGPGQSGSAQIAEMSEVAAIQVQALELGLVREARPVFVYDSKLAQEKKAGAQRQAKYMQRLAAEGIAMAKVPVAVLDQVKANGGDWSKLSAPKEVIKEVQVPGPVVTKEVIKEVQVPGPTVYKEKIVEKPVLKLTAEQKKALKIGEKALSLTGWKLKIARFVLSF